MSEQKILRPHPALSVYDIRNKVGLWLRTKAEHESGYTEEQRAVLRQLACDAEHSALIYRLLLGAAVLPEAPDWMGPFVAPPECFVPADAVCITPEIAATAMEACNDWLQRNEAERGKWLMNQDEIAANVDKETRYRAAAAALRGEG